MSRILKETEVEGNPAVALFDTRPTFTYVRSTLISETPRTQIKRPAYVVRGGQEIDVTEVFLIQGKIEGLDFFADAVPVNELGRADGHQLDAILGANTLERWEIKLDPKSGELDLEGLRRREFTEY